MSGSIWDSLPSQDSIAQSLSSPLVQALAGMTQGFGQASMPSRMPVPFSAALGMGMGGLGQGLATSQQLQRGDIQNQQARIGLDYYKNAMGQIAGGGGPMGVPTVDSNGQYMVSPRQLSLMSQALIGMGKDPSSVMKLIESYATAGRAIDRNSNVMSIPGFNEAVGSEAAAKGFGTKSGEFAAPAVPITIDVPNGKGGTEKRTMTPQQYQSYVAGNGGATAPSTAATPPGDQNLPRGLRNNNPLNLEYREGQGAVGTDGRFGIYQTPEHGVAANARQLLNYQDTHGLNTVTGIVNRWAPPSENNSKKYAANVAGLMGIHPDAPIDLHDSGTMTKLVSSMGQIENGRMIDPAVVGRGVQMAFGGAPVQVAGPGAPTGAAPPVPGAQVAPESGAAGSPMPPTPVGVNPNAPVDVAARTQPVAPPLGAAVPSNVPAAPTQGVPTGMPVLTPEQEAALKVQTARAMPYDLRQGGMHIDPLAGTEVKNPELKEITLPDGTKQFVHINPASPNAPPGSPGIAAPVGLPGSPAMSVGSAVAPDTQAARTHLVEEFHGKDTDSYVAAKNTQGWLNQIDHAAAVINKAGGMYQTGPFAETRLGLMSNINDAGRSAGLGSPFNQNALASAEELRKATTTAGFELSSHYEGHARQAASTIQNATSAVPGMSNSPQGVQLVAAGIREGAQSAIDSHEYRQARLQGQDPYALNPSAVGKTSGAGLETAETDFYKKFSPEMYSTRAISTVQPPAMKASSAEDFARQADKYLPGTQVILNGQPKIIPPRPGAPPIPNYIQQRFMQPQAPH